MTTCVHTPWPYSYIGGSLIAEQLMHDGWKQTQCPGCGLWKQWWKNDQILTETVVLRDEWNQS